MNLTETVIVDDPVPMEIIPLKHNVRIGQNFGYVLYKSSIKCEAQRPEDSVMIRGLKTKLKGRAHFYLDSVEVASPILLENEESTQVDSIQFNMEKETADFLILVENPGRINFEPKLSLDGEYKGRITIRICLLIFNF